MRTRQEIENSGIQHGNTFIGDDYKKLLLEVLLDIRDLLSKKEEITEGTNK